jgi:gas vesicle protein
MAGKKGGLIFGVMIGTLMGILFAPRKGKEWMSKVVKEIDEGGLGTKTIGNNFKKMGQDIAETALNVYDNPRLKRGLKKNTKSVKQFYGKFIKSITALFLSSKKNNDDKGSAAQ